MSRSVSAVVECYVSERLVAPQWLECSKYYYSDMNEYYIYHWWVDDVKPETLMRSQNEWKHIHI